MGQRLKISPLVVLISLVIWGWILGVVGAILAVPITLMILSVLKSFEATSWIAVLAQPASSSEEHERTEASRRLNALRDRTASLLKSEPSEPAPSAE